jgi:site-specific recombinase XerD
MKAGTIRIRDGKGHVARNVGIDPTSRLVIARWVDARVDVLGQPLNRGPLFCQLDGRAMSKSAAQGMVKRAARRAGLGDKRVHPHAFRHTHAVDLVREGVGMALIQRQLGHSNLNTTAAYLVGLHPGEVIERMNQRRWGSEALGSLDIAGFPEDLRYLAG